MDSSEKLKPIIKKQNFYQVMLLRDDCEVKNFKIKKRTLRFLILSLVSLCLLGSAGLAFGIHSLQKNYKLKNKYQVASSELSKIRLELEELDNVKSLIIATDTSLPRAKNDEITNPNLNSTQHSPAMVDNDDLTVIKISNATKISSQNNLFLNASKASENSEDTNSTLPEAPVIAPLTSDKSPVHITDFSTNISDSGIKISYSLNTAKQNDEYIRGTTRYVAIPKNGSSQSLQPDAEEDAHFSISRMKSMEIKSQLPEELPAKDIESIRVTVELENGDAFQDQFSVKK